MKGFKKDGKFIPTGNKAKSNLKKADVRKKQTVGVKEVNNILRTKKGVDSGLKVTGIKFWTAENYNVKYHINDEGEVVYDGGIGKALESLGARKLSTKEIGTLISMDDDTDFDQSEFYGDNETKKISVAKEYASEKQNDNSQNFLPPTDEDYNFGLFKVKGSQFLAIDSHEEDDAIYDLMFIPDEEGLDVDHQSWYAGALINPRLEIEFEINGKKGRVMKYDERDGKYQELEVDGDSNADEDEVFGEYAEGLDTAIEKFANKKK